MSRKSAEGTQAGKPRGRPFTAGNPGRPRGSRNKTSLAVAALLDGEAEALTRKAVELAIGGDTVALRLCLERICPPRKDRPVHFSMPAIKTQADLPKATHALLQAVAAGDLTPSEASDIGRAVDAHVRAVELTEVAERLARLEEMQARQA
ncbi:DUF5681 domain-containing protein [Methylobacterium nodulans]|uniref:DUF5681 domain-containing protein n=1 Tax=Methylobacterium nodulans (strain LMG 21967 / CNCM I-2342 / ORS 2060) TaxID=460265 RepID=B8IDT9_METNO|nr:DUF5681 domain-containing protein [Methylobacterium nodulans]ACL55661.1 conserved hypothetical protein [Methylobacterium nodulans ORS 2060]